MLLEKLIAILLVIILAVLAVLVYDNFPKEPIALESLGLKGTNIEPINYGTTPVFSENLRFNHNDISYFIDSSCSDRRRASMERAFNLFEKEMEIISFFEMENNNADILVGCSNDFISVGENLFAAGEGGPSRIINTSLFRTIEKGKILLYEDQRCDYPVVEMHELCHVFGFDHSPNPKNTMYRVSKCDQRITPDMIELIRELYAIKPLPEAVITELNATRRGRYLDFNITVFNKGLLGIPSISLTIFSGEKKIEIFSLGSIDLGHGQTLKVKNVKLPLQRNEEIEFRLDAENLIEEFDEENNIAKMILT